MVISFQSFPMLDKSVVFKPAVVQRVQRSEIPCHLGHSRLINLADLLEVEHFRCSTTADLLDRTLIHLDQTPNQPPVTSPPLDIGWRVWGGTISTCAGDRLGGSKRANQYRAHPGPQVVKRGSPPRHEMRSAASGSFPLRGSHISHKTLLATIIVPPSTI